MSRLFGLYVHVPFCVQKCFYCDFATAPFVPERIDRLIKALGREIVTRAREVSGQAVSVFFGGGTPSLLMPEQLGRVLETLQLAFSIAPNAEITVEANPETVDFSNLAAYRALGVNRLSIGAQDFDDATLVRLGRTHTAAHIERAVEAARRAGLDNLNLDLMFGLPGQDLAAWKQTLERALKLHPEHLSVYQLTLEPKTVFGRWHRRGRLTLPDEDQSAAMYALALDRIESAGYVHYEISNFARPGFQSQHNRIYWENRPYLGFGPSAWSFWEGVRFGNVPGTQTYLMRVEEGRSPVAEQERLTGRRAWVEALLMGLRLREGVSIEAFHRRYGVRLPDALGEAFERLERAGLIECRAGRIRLTRRGLFVADAVFVELL